MRIYYKDRKGNILKIRDYIEYNVFGNDTPNYIPRKSEKVIINKVMYIVESIVTDLDNNVINIMLYDN